MKRNESMTTDEGHPQTESAAGKVALRRPVTHVVQRTDAIEVTLEVPGVSADGVELLCEGRRLVVRARRAAWTPPEGMYALHREIRHGSFEVALELPAGIAAEGIEADLRAGLLVLTLPRRVAGKRTIPVSGD